MVRMKAERLKRQWTQQDLSYHARVPAADVSRIESRRMQPYPRHAARLAKVLELAPEELLEEMGVEEHACDAAYTVWLRSWCRPPLSVSGRRKST
jgi:ribosome-binding protein aMBF1 (putative translation factor)